MAEEDELYISIHPETYRRGKSGILIAESAALISMKRLHNLKVLMRHKNSLKEDLKRVMSSISKDIDAIQERMPTKEVPKAIKKVISPVKKKETKAKIEPQIKELPKTKHDALDMELMIIQNKLRELNS